MIPSLAFCNYCNEDTNWVEDVRTGDTICVACGFVKMGQVHFASLDS